MSEVKINSSDADPAASPATAKSPIAPASATKLLVDPYAVLETKDDRGRVIKFRKLNAAQRLRLIKLVGGELATNRPYFGTCALAATVVEIDGEEIPFPSSVVKLEAMVGRLDDAGADAIGAKYAEVFGINDDGEEEIADAKN